MSSQASNPGSVTLHAGSAMQLQHIGEECCAVVSTGLQATTDAPTVAKATLVQEGKNGTTKLRVLQGKGTVSVGTADDGTTIEITGDIPEVTTSTASKAVSLLTDDRKLRKLRADENSGMTIAPSSSTLEAKHSLHKPIIVVNVTTGPQTFTLNDVEKNNLHIFRVQSPPPLDAVITVDITPTAQHLCFQQLFFPKIQSHAFSQRQYQTVHSSTVVFVFSQNFNKNKLSLELEPQINCQQLPRT